MPIAPVTRSFLLLIALSSAPAWAQSASSQSGLDPRAASAITTMTGISLEFCKRGSKEACEFVEKLQTATTRLVAAQEACVRRMRGGCEALEQGISEISVVYGRFGDGAGLIRTLPQGGGVPGTTSQIR